MEIAQLNRLLLELSPSEQRYREGETYDWAGPSELTMIDGRRVLQMDQGVDGSPRYLDANLGQGDRRPMADLLLLRRNSRFNPVPEHIHSHIEISYVYAGSCPQTVNGRSMTLRENQVLLLVTIGLHDAPVTARSCRRRDRTPRPPRPGSLPARSDHRSGWQPPASRTRHPLGPLGERSPRSPTAPAG